MKFNLINSSTYNTAHTLGIWDLGEGAGPSVMDVVYTSHILLIHFITTRTFDIESLYHSTYFLNISFNTMFYHLKTQKLLSYLLCSIYYIFATLE